MHLLRRVSALFAALFLLIGIQMALPTVQAQDGGPAFEILNCVDGQGCSYDTPADEVTKSDIELTLGEEDTSGNGLLVCAEAGGCTWAEASMEDIDLLYGGDGEPEGTMIFDDDEVDPVEDDDEDVMEFDEDEVDPVEDAELGQGFIFDESDAAQTNIVPRDGQWTTYHQAGQMVCPGAMTLDIPAGDVTTGTLTVLDGGSSLHGEDLDPETAELDMQRRLDGVYGAELTLNIEGGTMHMYWEQVFVSDTFAVGLIHGQFEQQGMTCIVRRPFYSMHSDGIQIEEDGDDEMPNLVS